MILPRLIIGPKSYQFNSKTKRSNYVFWPISKVFSVGRDYSYLFGNRVVTTNIINLHMISSNIFKTRWPSFLTKEDKTT